MEEQTSANHTVSNIIFQAKLPHPSVVSMSGVHWHYAASHSQCWRMHTKLVVGHYQSHWRWRKPSRISQNLKACLQYSLYKILKVAISGNQQTINSDAMTKTWFLCMMLSNIGFPSISIEIISQYFITPT